MHMLTCRLTTAILLLLLRLLLLLLLLLLLRLLLLLLLFASELAQVTTRPRLSLPPARPQALPGLWCQPSLGASPPGASSLLPPGASSRAFFFFEHHAWNLDWLGHAWELQRSLTIQCVIWQTTELPP